MVSTLELALRRRGEHPQHRLQRGGHRSPSRYSPTRSREIDRPRPRDRGSSGTGSADGIPSSASSTTHSSSPIPTSSTSSSTSGSSSCDALAGLIDTPARTPGPWSMTFHRTRDIEIEGELVSLSSIRHGHSRAVDRLIVHQESDARMLADIGLTDNVSVVPIGTAPSRPRSRIARRAKVIGLGSTAGDRHLRLSPSAQGNSRAGPRGRLVARPRSPTSACSPLCATTGRSARDVYEEHRPRRDRERGLERNVLLDHRLPPEETSRSILRGVDAVVLAYRETEESSSAAIRFVLPLERPVIVTDKPIFADCRDSVLAVDPADPTAMRGCTPARPVRRPARLGPRRCDRARPPGKLRWSRIASEHRQIYAAARRSLRTPGGRGRPRSRIASLGCPMDWAAWGNKAQEILMHVCARRRLPHALRSGGHLQ